MAPDDTAARLLDPVLPTIPRLIHVGPLEHIGFGVLLVFLFLSYSRIMDFRLPYLHLPLLASVTALTIAALTGGIKRAFASPIGICLALLTAWILVAIPFSFWKGGSVQFVLDLWSKSFLSYVMVAGIVKTSKQCCRAAYSIALGVLVVAILALYFRHTIEGGRLGLPLGMLTNPNDLAQVILIGMPLWLLMVTIRSGLLPVRIFAALCLAPLLLVLFKTGSRAGLVTFALLSALTFFRVSLPNKVKLVCAVLVITGLCYPLLPHSLRDRYKTLYSDNAPTDQMSALESKQERLELLITSLKLTFRHPLFGVGPGQFEAAAAADSRANRTFAHWRETHNMYTQVSSEAGIPAVLFYIAAVVYCFKEISFIRKFGNRIRKQVRAMQAAGSFYETDAHARLVRYCDDMTNTAFCLGLSLISFFVFAWFSSTAYHFFFPTLAGLTAALGQAARAELRPALVESSNRAKVALPPLSLREGITV
jgi:O-antigen ligase